MNPTVAAALIGGAVMLVSTVLAYFGSRHIPRAQRENLAADTANKVIAMQDNANQALVKRVTDLEAVVAGLTARAEEKERELERSHGENAKLSAEIGTLRAQLTAKEAELQVARTELAVTRAQLATATQASPVPTGGAVT